MRRNHALDDYPGVCTVWTAFSEFPVALTYKSKLVNKERFLDKHDLSTAIAQAKKKGVGPIKRLQRHEHGLEVMVNDMDEHGRE